VSERRHRSSSISGVRAPVVVIAAGTDVEQVRMALNQGGAYLVDAIESATAAENEVTHPHVESYCVDVVHIRT
jgi:hypothetical protein